MRRGRVLLPSLAAGLLVAGSVPPWGLWPLAGPGLGLLAWRLAGLPARSRMLAGLAAGIGLFGPTLAWAVAFNAAGYGLLVIVESAFLVGACLLVPPGRGRSPAFPGALVLAYAARSAWPLGGLPLGGIALGQAGGPLLGAARVGGPLLVTGLAAAAGVCLANLAHVVGLAHRTARMRLVDRARLGRDRLGRLGLGRCGGPALAAAVVVVGAAAASQLAPDGGPAVSRMSVAAVQGGGPRGLRAIQVNPDVVYEAELGLTERLRPPLDLVLWPEDVISLDHPLRGSAVAAQVGGAAKALGTTLVAGVTATVGRTHFTNQAVAWSPAGQIVASYEKVHRVPFGEYVPARSLLRHVVNLADVPRDAIPGHGPGLLRTPAGPLGVMVSYEVFFASRARAAVRAGGQLLIVPTNTSSYAGDQVPSQEVAADRLRAVEEGRDLVQAGPTGYTTVVDHRGRVRARSGLGVPQVIQARVERRHGLTLYAQGGDTPELALAGLLVILGWALDARSRRRLQTVTPASGAESLNCPCR